MDYIISASTDIGIKKETNQDGLSVSVIDTGAERIAFVVLCDGMGGLSKGELASAEIVRAFNAWLYDGFPKVYEYGVDEQSIRRQWSDIVNRQNKCISEYGSMSGINIGTTVVAALFVGSRYFMMNVGDSRAYEIKDDIRLITRDHSVVFEEVEIGKITPEQALVDPRRSVLTQCIGASYSVEPDFYFGETLKDAVYMFCSDGLVHEVSENEIYSYLNPDILDSKEAMQSYSDALIELNKSRYEKDNISVATVRTY